MKWLRRISDAVVVGLMLVSCHGAGMDPDPVDPPSPPEEPAPVKESCTPYDGYSSVEDSALSVTIRFNQEISCSADALEKVQITKGGMVSSIGAFGKNLVIKVYSLVPATSYLITIPDGVVSGLKNNPCPMLIYRFSTAPIVPVDDSVVLNPVASLTNVNATPEAKKLYEFLLAQSGHRMLSGVQVDGPGNKDTSSESIYRITGKHPALLGFDFMFLHYSPTPASWTWVVDFSDMSHVIDHWEHNGIVNYMWHWKVPSTQEGWRKGKENYDFSEYAFYSKETTFSIENALTEGTWEHDLIIQDMDKVASYLKILQDNKVPVIWRPLHEAAGNYDLYGKKNNAWFWWGLAGPEACKNLWRMMHDRFEKEHGLNNLIWVWTHVTTKGTESQWADWYPGDAYVDVVGVDIYSESTGAKNFEYAAAVNHAGGKKLVAISECGNMPSPAYLFAAKNKWSWFMTWGISQTDYPKNTFEHWREIMDDEHVYCRENMPSLK